MFNFKTGAERISRRLSSAWKDDILVIEGIHGLNDKLSYALPKESKFKIYISAFTQLKIHEHNRIPTTDGRLIRRIVRDARTEELLQRIPLQGGHLYEEAKTEYFSIPGRSRCYV